MLEYIGMAIMSFDQHIVQENFAHANRYLLFELFSSKIVRFTMLLFRYRRTTIALTRVILLSTKLITLSR